MPLVRCSGLFALEHASRPAILWPVFVQRDKCCKHLQEDLPAFSAPFCIDFGRNRTR